MAKKLKSHDLGIVIGDIIHNPKMDLYGVVCGIRRRCKSRCTMSCGFEATDRIPPGYKECSSTLEVVDCLDGDALHIRRVPEEGCEVIVNMETHCLDRIAELEKELGNACNVIFCIQAALAETKER